MLVKDKHLLCVRNKGKKLFYLPGGKRRPGESDREALIREIREELQVDLIPDSLAYKETFIARADQQPEGLQVRLRCFTAGYEGRLQAGNEIEELAWLGYNERSRISVAGSVVLDYLKQQGEI